jgi:hypothetical protein
VRDSLTTGSPLMTDQPVVLAVASYRPSTRPTPRNGRRFSTPPSPKAASPDRLPSEWPNSQRATRSKLLSRAAAARYLERQLGRPETQMVVG